jgi:hypothetical protein
LLGLGRLSPFFCSVWAGLGRGFFGPGPGPHLQAFFEHFSKTLYSDKCQSILVDSQNFTKNSKFMPQNYDQTNMKIQTRFIPKPYSIQFIAYEFFIAILLKKSLKFPKNIFRHQKQIMYNFVTFIISTQPNGFDEGAQ